MIKTLLLTLISIYQWALSPLLGKNCRFYPSCSDYCKQAISSHGSIKGLQLSCKRILRCHPFSDGGIDPVPPKT